MTYSHQNRALLFYLSSCFMRGLTFIVIAVFCLGSFSCTLQRRHYRKGFYFTTNATAKPVAKQQVPVLAASKITTPTLHTADHADEKEISQKINTTDQNIVFQKKERPLKKLLVKKLPVAISKLFLPLPSAKPAYGDVKRNHVPKAGFRMMIIGMIFFAGAWLSLSELAGLLYVTIILSCIASVFILVSFITSVNAPKDKINNSKGWVAMAIIDAILDILLIIALTLFFISLF